MKEKGILRFSWTSLLLITSLCFFAFSRLLKILDDAVPRVFLWTGFIALGLGCLSLIAKLVIPQKPSKPVRAEETPFL